MAHFQIFPDTVKDEACPLKKMDRELLRINRNIAFLKNNHFGELHLETVETNFRIAKILYVLDENEEAFTVLEDVYSKLKIISGPEDELTLTARGYLANILRRTGKEALPIYQEIHEILSRKSPHKIITLNIKINMASELCDQGKFSESLDILDEVIRIHRHLNSAEDEIWFVLGRKFCVLCKQGKYREATVIAKSLHEEQKAALGEDYIGTWYSLRDLGVVLADQGEYDQAEGIFKVVLNHSRKKNDDENIRRDQLFLALALKKQGKLDESLALLKDLYKNLKSDKSLRSALLYTMKLLAKIVDQQGKYEEALHLYREILKIDPQPGSPDFALTLKNVNRTTVHLGKSDKKGPSTNELYEIESKKFWELIAEGNTEKYVEDYPFVKEHDCF